MHSFNNRQACMRDFMLCKSAVLPLFFRWWWCTATGPTGRTSWPCPPVTSSWFCPSTRKRGGSGACRTASGATSLPPVWWSWARSVSSRDVGPSCCFSSNTSTWFLFRKLIHSIVIALIVKKIIFQGQIYAFENKTKIIYLTFWKLRYSKLVIIGSFLCLVLSMQFSLG